MCYAHENIMSQVEGQRGRQSFIAHVLRFLFFFLALGLRYAIYSYWYNRSVRLHLSIPLHLLIASILFPARHDHLQFRITRE